MVDGNSVNLASIDTDTDDQTLSLSGNTLSIQDGNSVVLPSSTSLADADDDTKIQVEESPDEDIIRVDIEGTEHFTLHKGRMEFLNNGNSVFLGQSAGANDDFSDNRNVAIGREALELNTSGRWNSAVGFKALEANTSGQKNVANGFAALLLNQTGSDNIGLGYFALYNTTGNQNIGIGSEAGRNNIGSGNIFIGHNAGKSSSGSNLLYLDNSDNATPLIYGEFDNDSLRVNGSMGIAQSLNIDGGLNVNIGNLFAGGGRVGIGTTSPDENLHVEGGIKFGPNIRARNSSGINFRSDDGTVVMKLTDDNKIGIGNLFPDGKLHVEGEICAKGWIHGGVNDEGVLVNVHSTNGTTTTVGSRIVADNYVMLVDNKSDGVSIATRYNGMKINAGRNSNDGHNSRFIQFTRPDGTEIGKIIQNNSTTVAYNTTSDRRLKQNIRPTHFSIEDLMKIQVRDYVFTDDPTDPQTGFIAQELYEVYPEPVTVGGKDAKTEPWNVEYGKLTPLLVKAIQDQQAIIDAQKSEIEMLRAQQNEFTEKMAQIESYLNLNNQAADKVAKNK